MLCRDLGFLREVDVITVQPLQDDSEDLQELALGRNLGHDLPLLLILSEKVPSALELNRPN